MKSRLWKLTKTKSSLLIVIGAFFHPWDHSIQAWRRGSLCAPSCVLQVCASFVANRWAAACIQLIFPYSVRAAAAAAHRSEDEAWLVWIGRFQGFWLPLGEKMLCDARDLIPAPRPKNARARARGPEAAARGQTPPPPSHFFSSPRCLLLPNHWLYKSLLYSQWAQGFHLPLVTSRSHQNAEDQ